jgi:tetratricopeptide (TPR) repeat protein
LFGLPAPTSLVTFLVGFLLLGSLFSSLEMNRAGRIEAALRAAPLDEVQEMDDPAMVASAMIPLRNALPQRWDDALAQQRMAEMRMQLYRAETYARLRELQATPESTGSDSPVDESSNERDEELWNRASVWHWHQTVRQRQREGDATGAAQLIRDPVVQDTLVPAARALLVARQSAPTIPQVHLLLAELSPLVPLDGDETVHLQRTALLSPGDATLLYWVGLIDLQSGRRESACRHWRQSLTLAPLHLADVMSSARGRLTNGQLLREVIPERSDLLLRVAQQYFAGEDSAGVRTAFLERAAETLDQTELPADEWAYVAATVYRMLGRPQEAIEQYREAISRNQQKLAWRYEYARLLFEQEMYDEAYQEATFLVRAQPERIAYERLMKEVNARRLRQGTPQRDESR